MRVAVIGSGISGLSAARLLDRRHSVEIFEAANYAGGHTNTVVVKEGKRELSIDTGFIVFNDRNYPNLTSLFNQLGVESRDSDMSFSVRAEADDLEYNGTSLGKLFSQRANVVSPRFWSMLGDIYRFNSLAKRHLREQLSESVTVSDYCQKHNFNHHFYQYYLVPLGASLWSCDAGRFGRFPMRFVIEFLDNHRMLQINDRPVWKTVKGGSRTYVDRLLREFSGHLHLNKSVRSIVREQRGVRVYLENGHSEKFDEVVMACHADQALKLVADGDETERDVLSRFPYQKNHVVLHTDTSVLPERPGAWASWNYRVPAVPQDSVTVTYNMNMLQGLDSYMTYCVSLNLNQRINAKRIKREFIYMHPVFLPDRASAQRRHAELIRRRGVSYCGAYWGYGFHEDGLVSAIRVCESFDMELAA